MGGPEEKVKRHQHFGYTLMSGGLLDKKIELDFKGCAGPHCPSRIKDTFTQQYVEVNILLLQQNWQGESLP